MTTPGFSPRKSQTANSFAASRESMGSVNVSRPAGLPFLPGYSFNDPKRTDFHKQHCFDAKNGYGIMREAPTRGGPAEVVTADNFPRVETASFGVRDRGFSSDFKPHFVEYSQKTLKFYAYFKEAVPESPLEQFRIRRCNILYHLVDHTISIAEPKEENSGMIQGRFLRRQHIAKAGQGNLQDPCSTAGSEFYSYKDFNIGIELTFYERTYRIYNCDDFTYDFLMKQGIAVNQAEEIPADHYQDARIARTKLNRPKKDHDLVDPLRQFLDHDRKVLKFMAVWDDRDSVYGNKHYYIVYYFLADDTMQVVRQKDTSLSAENDPFISLLKRRKMPRNIETPDFSDKKIEYYNELDLSVGRTLYVLGRQIFIYDADQYTRYHYRVKHSIELDSFIDISDPSMPMPTPTVPPPTGFGSEEDSMTSVQYLHPKPPKRDFRKFLLKDGEVLRFGAYLETKVPEDIGRRFIIGVYMMDEPVTLAIYEIKLRNAGRSGGKFLERRRVEKPGTGQPYRPGDFFVGAKLEIYSHRFILTEADEYSLNYMENEDMEFPKANLDIICEKLQRSLILGNNARAAFTRADRDGSGSISIAEFKQCLSDIGALSSMAEQEIITIMRVFDRNHDGRISYNELLDVCNPQSQANPRSANQSNASSNAEAEMNRRAEQQRSEQSSQRLIRVLNEKLYNRRKLLEVNLRKGDKDGDGHITPDLLRATLESLSIYLTEGELQVLRSAFTAGSSSLIRYQDFLRAVCR